MDDKAKARKVLLERELTRFVRILTKEDDPDTVIVFGSLATGDIHEWSDIDLVVIGQTTLPFIDRLCKAQSQLQPQVGTDILYYTPKEFAQLCKERLFFQEEILKKGKVVYERNRN